MTEYISVLPELDALAINPDIEIKLEGSELTCRYRSIFPRALSSQTALLRFENQVETGAQLLGDGFQMLCQTTGSPTALVDVGRCPDNNASYRLYPQDAPKRFYNYLVVEQSTGFQLYGFVTCHRFAGYFELEQTHHGIDVVAYLDGEESEPQYWETNQLESLVVVHGSSLESVYERYAQHITNHHPARSGVTEASQLDGVRGMPIMLK